MGSDLSLAQVPFYAAGIVKVDVDGNITSHKTTGRVTANKIGVGLLTLVTSDEIGADNRIVQIQIRDQFGIAQVDPSGDTTTFVRTQIADGTETGINFSYTILSLPVAQ